MSLVHSPGCFRVCQKLCSVDKSYLWQIYVESAHPSAQPYPPLPPRAPYHARPDTTPHTTPTRLTRLSLRALALRRAHRRATRPGVHRARTRRARRRGRGPPRQRRRAARAQRIAGHVQRVVRELALRHGHERAYGGMARGKGTGFNSSRFFLFLFFLCIHALVITGTDGSVVHPCETEGRCVRLSILFMVVLGG